MSFRLLDRLGADAFEDGLSLNDHAWECLRTWTEAGLEAGVVTADSNYLDVAVRTKLLDWLDESGTLETTLPDPGDLPPGSDTKRMRRDAAEVALGIVAALLMEFESNAQRVSVLPSEEGVELFHRPTSMGGSS